MIEPVEVRPQIMVPQAVLCHHGVILTVMHVVLEFHIQKDMYGGDKAERQVHP